MTTAEQRSQRGRHAARVRWALGPDGRALRAEMYYRRIKRAILTGDPRSLTPQRKRDVDRLLFGVPFGDE